MVVSCFARSAKAFGRMAVWPIHANDLRKTPEFSATLTEKRQRQIVRSEDNGQKISKEKEPERCGAHPASPQAADRNGCLLRRDRSANFRAAILFAPSASNNIRTVAQLSTFAAWVFPGS
jgi:hypothetical protein